MNININNDELLDIVDEHDNVIGQKWRSEIDVLGFLADVPLNIRSINAFIENDKGQLWIPRRTKTKQRWPNALDMSVSGCVGAGESYELAFEREAAEEINVDIHTVPWNFVTYLTPHTHDVRSFMKVYNISMNEAPNFNRDDYSEYSWMKPQEVMDRISGGTELFKPGLPKLLRIVYDVK